MVAANTPSKRLCYPIPRSWVAGHPEGADADVANVASELFASLAAHLSRPDYPCVAALRALGRREYSVGHYGALGTGRFAAALRHDLLHFIAAHAASRSPYLTMWAAFPDTGPLDDEHFERALWDELSSLTSEAQRATDWPANATTDVDARDFLFHLNGHAIFVVGMHPHSVRRSRRLPFPALVFNLFAQFEDLKTQGTYDAMVATNRARDERFDGSVNPMALQHGETWETIQYSGRDNSTEWRCPFRFK